MGAERDGNILGKIETEEAVEMREAGASIETNEAIGTSESSDISEAAEAIESFQTDEPDGEEQERARRRRERIRQMRLEKERRLRLNRIFRTVLPVAVFLLAAGIVFFVRAVSAKGTEKTGRTAGHTNTVGAAEPQGSGQGDAETLLSEGEPSLSDKTAHLPGGSGGENAVLPEADSGEQDNPEADSVERDNLEAADSEQGDQEAGNPEPDLRYSAHTTAQTAAPPDEVNSPYAVFIDLESGEILAQRDYLARIVPASMTKVLTVLVAAEHVADLDAPFTITIDITDYSYSNGCSSVGFDVGETVTVRDLFYGTVLPSGGDAAVALATYVAGSHEAFVEMMNEKAEALGIGGTAHFTNCVGLYDEAHYCTVYDMAVIMEAALDNELCREVLNAHIYTTSETAEHPEGITISNWFLRKIEDKDTGGEVLCAKTGYVVQSNSCAVSYGMDRSGREYVCVTAGAYSSWRCIYDHVALYKKYAKA